MPGQTMTRRQNMPVWSRLVVGLEASATGATLARCGPLVLFQWEAERRHSGQTGLSKPSINNRLLANNTDTKNPENSWKFITENTTEGYTVHQCCPTCGPRATCGPRRHSVWPTKAHENCSLKVFLPESARMTYSFTSTVQFFSETCVFNWHHTLLEHAESKATGEE